MSQKDMYARGACQREKDDVAAPAAQKVLGYYLTTYSAGPLNQYVRRLFMADTPVFDVFLSYNKRDREFVSEIARKLEGRGLRPWLDEEQLTPGQSWQGAIADAMGAAKSVAVFIGPDGVGKWQALELRSFLDRAAEEGLRIIPVLLPGLQEIPDNIPFLRHVNSVRFTEGVHDEQALKRLEWGITGGAPGRELETTRASATEHFDVLLCFRSSDFDEVKKIAERLKEYHVRPWPERWDLPVEAVWHELLIKQPGQIDSLAVFAGNTGGPWEEEEVESFVWEFMESGRLVVPIILPNVTTAPKLPIYLRRKQIVDLREEAPNQLSRLARRLTDRTGRQEGAPHE